MNDPLGGYPCRRRALVGKEEPQCTHGSSAVPRPLPPTPSWVSAALQIDHAGAITHWPTFGHSEARVRGTGGHRSINDVRSTANRNPERLRFIIHAPAAVNVNPGTMSWTLFCWNELNARQGSASATFVLNDPFDVRGVLFQVAGGVASYQFCELRVDGRQGNQGNVETFLRARYP
jgi:hypothetical protein